MLLTSIADILKLITEANKRGGYKGKFEDRNAEVLSVQVKKKPKSTTLLQANVRMKLAGKERTLFGEWDIRNGRTDLVRIDGKDVPGDDVQFHYGAKAFPPRVWMSLRFLWQGKTKDGQDEQKQAEVSWSRSLLPF